MLVEPASVSSSAIPVGLFSFEEEKSRPRLRSRPRAKSAPPPSASLREPRSDCPHYETDVLDGDVLSVRVLEQLLGDDRGLLLEHVVQGRLKQGSLELELYRSKATRLRLLSVGVWTCGAYVHWRNERALDFILLDTVDLVLRHLLPAGGGVVTLESAGALASGDGAKWGSFRS